MPQIELHRGPYWAVNQFEQWMPDMPQEMLADTKVRETIVSEILQRFHETAKHNGSSAVWLSQAGCLVTSDKAEPNRGLRYYLWRKQAIDATIARWKKIRLN